MEFLNRAWPANDALLKELFEIRREHAHLLGYADWADYDAEVKMIKARAPRSRSSSTGSPWPRPSAWGARPAWSLDRMRQDHPDAETIDASDLLFYAEAVRREQLDVDARLVRTYFDFPRVRQGLLDVAGWLFGLRYEPVLDAAVWDEAVTAYDVLPIDGVDPIGRIYLDLHPREGKYKHAAQFDLVWLPYVVDHYLRSPATPPCSTRRPVPRHAPARAATSTRSTTCPTRPTSSARSTSTASGRCAAPRPRARTASRSSASATGTTA